jgi:hypothetical protein
LHFFLNVYKAFLTDLNAYLTGLAALNVYVAGLLQYIFFYFFYFICNVLCSQFGQYFASATLLIHWSMLASCISTTFLFACCCCSCLHVRLVAVCTFGVLQPTIAIGTTSFLVDWLSVAYLFVGCCLLLFDSNLQGLGPAATVGPFGGSYMVSCLLLSLLCVRFAMLGCCIRSWICCYIVLQLTTHKILLR